MHKHCPIKSALSSRLCTAPVGEGDLCVHFKEDKNLMAEWEDSPLQITGYMSENTFS